MRYSIIHLYRFSVVGRIMIPPKDVYMLISRTHEYVTSYDKMDFADMIKVRILEGEFIMDYLDGPNVCAFGP